MLLLSSLLLVLGQLQLKRIPPNDFEHQLTAAPLTLVLFCQASQGTCSQLEQQLAEVAAKLAAERSPASVHMVDTSEWGGEALRMQYGTTSVAAELMPELILFQKGLASVYRGRRDAAAILVHLRALAKGRTPPQQQPPAVVSNEPPEPPVDGVLELDATSLLKSVNTIPPQIVREKSS